MVILFSVYFRFIVVYICKNVFIVGNFVVILVLHILLWGFCVYMNMVYLVVSYCCIGLYISDILCCVFLVYFCMTFVYLVEFLYICFFAFVICMVFYVFGIICCVL